MKPRTNDQTLNIRIPNTLHEQLKVIAEAQYMPVSVMVRLALAEYVRTHATSALSKVVAQQNAPQQPQPPRKPSQVFMTPEQEAQYNADWDY